MGTENVKDKPFKVNLSFDISKADNKFAKVSVEYHNMEYDDMQMTQTLTISALVQTLLSAGNAKMSPENQKLLAEFMSAKKEEENERTSSSY